MFGSNLASRIYVPKSSRGNRGLVLLYSRCVRFNLSRTARFSSMKSNVLNYKLFTRLSANILHNTGKCFMPRCQTTQASVVTKKENDKQITPNFKELMIIRKDQAHRSVLLHIPTKDDIPFALAKCEQFGNIANAFSYFGENSNYFMLIEFSDKIATQDLFKNCQHQHVTDIFPVFSRIIEFKKKSKTSLPKVNIEVQEDSNTCSPKTDRSISEVIEDIFSTEKLTELDTRLRYFFSILVKDSSSGIFPHCDVFPFGSSVNGIGRRGCDLDLMIRLYPDFDAMLKFHPDKANNDGELTFFNKTCIGQKSMQQKVVGILGDYFRTFLPGITSAQKILHARVPIMKMNHRLLKMDCDISVNNMSAVFMSDVVHFCGEVDPRFRPLLYAVKKWAKEAEVTKNTPGQWITNFGLTSLLIFFFQKERIFPSLKDALVIVGEENSPDYYVQYLKSIEELNKFASQNEKSLAELLMDFLSFLSEFQFDANILSLMSGKARPHSQDAVTIWVQYPFDEDLNVTKNVSEYEFSELRSKAGLAVKSLETKLKQRTFRMQDFSGLLGVSNSKKPKKMVDVSAYFESHNNHKFKATKYRRNIF